LRRPTLLLVATANAVNATLYDKLNYDFIRDIAPVAGIIRSPNVMQVHPSVPVTTVPEFIAYAKANPGKLNMASSGNGGPEHVTGELFKMMAGINLTHVPYRGAGPALTDLLGGQIVPTVEQSISGTPRGLRARGPSRPTKSTRARA
jgi:tripartite-type tricarboxylate transporter receptor subunit TctC